MKAVNLLKLDIDKPYNSKNIHATLMRIYQVTQIVFANGTEVCAIFKPSSHKNIHAFVLVKSKTRLTPMEITALQAIMGSDWRREAFNFVRAHHYRNLEDWQRWSNVLFISRTPFKREIKGTVKVRVKGFGRSPESSAYPSPSKPGKPKAMTRRVARLSGRAPGSRIEGGEI